MARGHARGAVVIETAYGHLRRVLLLFGLAWRCRSERRATARSDTRVRDVGLRAGCRDGETKPESTESVCFVTLTRFATVQ